MFFATTTPATFRRQMYAPAGRALERFMEQAQRANSQKAFTVEQDDQSFSLSFDVPGVSRDQLSIGIEGNVVRLSTKEGAPRQYRYACELPQEIDAAKSEAKLEHGVLALKIAKVIPMNRVTELTIQ
jgi:HSP20 family molecular chaperone IbpA